MRPASRLIVVGNSCQQALFPPDWVVDAMEEPFAQHGAPKHPISDQEGVFTSDGLFADLLCRWNVKQRFGAVGKHGSIAVTERVILTLKQEWLSRVSVIRGLKTRPESPDQQTRLAPEGTRGAWRWLLLLARHFPAAPLQHLAGGDRVMIVQKTHLAPKTLLQPQSWYSRRPLRLLCWEALRMGKDAERASSATGAHPWTAPAAIGIHTSVCARSTGYGARELTAVSLMPAAYQATGQQVIRASISAIRRMVSLRATTILW